jgi:PPOX class probable F420-dependent enzyme
MAFQLPDLSTPLGTRAAQRLRNDQFIWLTTVDARGAPQPTLVWFLWDDATSSLLIYSRSDARRLAHLQQNPRIALHFDGDGSGGDTIVFTGRIEVSLHDPPADHQETYLAKYRDSIQSPPNFASRHSVALRAYPISIRGYLGSE